MAHDFYHLPGYVELCAAGEGGKPLAFVAEEGSHRFFVPFILRPIDCVPVNSGELYDAISPYGYPSPLLNDGMPNDEASDFLEAALARFVGTLSEQSVVSLFLRLHPILPLPSGPFQRHGTLVHHGETVFVDLTRPEEDLWRETHRKCRKGIQVAQQSGCVAEIDHDWNCFDEYFEIYTQTMNRVGATGEYFFPKEYFYDLKRTLNGGLHLCLVRINDVAACAGVFTEVCGIVQSHLGGARSEYNSYEPSRLMFDYVRRWATERGNRVFHLGGGVGGTRDSLFWFKSGFSKARADFYTWRVAVDAEQYHALVREREPAATVQLDNLEGYFPAYRKSVPDPDAVPTVAP